MDALAQLALMTKAKLVFETADTFLSFPALSPLSYTPDQLNFGAAASGPGLQVFSEFSQIVNALPTGIIFQPSSDTLLPDIYLQILETAQIAQGTLTAQQAAQLQAADAVLYTQDQNGVKSPTAALVAYQQYQQAWITATQNYKSQQITAANSTDPAVQAQWQNVNEPLARVQVEAAETDWETKGFKAQIEAARQVEQTCAALSPQTKWQNWLSQCNPELDFLTDTNNQTFAPTVFSPSDIASQPNWPSFTVSSAEVPQLVSQAPKELSSIFGSASGSTAIDSLSFEFCSVVFNRPWFQKELFESRFWRFTDSSVYLSDGGAPPKGYWPAWITGAVLARNVIEKEHTVPTGPPPPPATVLFPHTFVMRPQHIVVKRLPVAAPSVVRAPMAMRTAVGPRFAMVAAPTAARSAAILARPSVASQLRVASFVSLPPPVPSGSPTTSGGSTSGQQSPDAAQVTVLAFICKQLPKCPNPDPSFTW